MGERFCLGFVKLPEEKPKIDFYDQFVFKVPISMKLWFHITIVILYLLRLLIVVLSFA